MAMRVVGLPKEIKTLEHRVALTPDNVRGLTKLGLRVVVESSAGASSGFSDAEYVEAGAHMVATHAEVFEQAELIVKVKEPIKSEWPLIKPHHVIFTYLHLAGSKELTEALLATGSTCIAYETVERADGSLPILAPMSEIAGRLSIQMGMRFLEKHNGGSGVLLAGVPGVKPGTVTVIGGGVAGTNAAHIAAGVGARVLLLDNNINRLRTLAATMPPNVTTVYSTPTSIEQCLKDSDLGVGAALVPGARAPVLVSRAMLESMRPGSVFVDISIDQGGMTEASNPTTHADPIIKVGATQLYCVANMPGCVPRTSTLAITNATWPYVVQLATKGWAQALAASPELLKGLNVADGKIVYPKIAEYFSMECYSPEEVVAAALAKAHPATSQPKSVVMAGAAAPNGNGKAVAACMRAPPAASAGAASASVGASVVRRLPARLPGPVVRPVVRHHKLPCRSACMRVARAMV